MWYEDLTPCNYFGSDVPFVAVGWLERCKPYSTGQVDRAVYDALVEMRKNPYQQFVYRGLHECDLCQFAGEARGCANLIVPANGVLYAAPELIVHYINAHGYAPPQALRDAVLACPRPQSMEYLRAVSAAGGAKLFGPTGDSAQ